MCYTSDMEILNFINCDIVIDHAGKFLVQFWKCQNDDYVPTENFRKIVGTTLQIFRKFYKCHSALNALIINTLQSSPVRQEDAAWAGSIITENLYKYGLRRMAIVTPEKKLAKKSITKFQNTIYTDQELLKTELKIREYNNYHNALDWAYRVG